MGLLLFLHLFLVTIYFTARVLIVQITKYFTKQSNGLTLSIQKGKLAVTSPEGVVYG